MIKKIKILIHYTHKETLGHTTRIIAIVNALIEKYGHTVSLHVLQGGIPQSYVDFPPAAHIINIPHPFDSRASFKGINGTRHHAIRAKFVLDQARIILPDIFITEFFPLGRMDYMPELLPTLKYLSQRKTRIYASVGYPYFQNLAAIHEKDFSTLFNNIIKLYDNILIHTPPELENKSFAKLFASQNLKKEYQSFFASIKSKTIYTGYVVPSRTAVPFSIPPTTISQRQHTIIVSRGSGTVYPKIIVNAIQTQAILGDRYRFIIACGPASSSKEKELFTSFQKKYNTGHVFLFDHIPRLDTLFQDCAVSISLCGYNTSVQLMQAGARTIIIPYQRHHTQKTTNDQLARAHLMQRHFQSTVISYLKLTPKTLAKAIQEKCQHPRPAPAPAEWFCGNATTADILMQAVK